MEQPTPKPRPGVPVHVAAMLSKAQAAIKTAKETNDIVLQDSADTVMSALVLVLKSQHAVLPEATRQHVARITGV